MRTLTRQRYGHYIDLVFRRSNRPAKHTTRDTPLVVIANWRDEQHPASGGAEVLCGRLAKNLAIRGYEVVFLTSSVNGSPHTETTDGYTIIRRGGRFTVYAWVLTWIWQNRRRMHCVIDTQNGIPFFAPLVVKNDTPVLMLLLHVHQDQFDLYFSPLVAFMGKWLERIAARIVYRDRTIVAISPSTGTGARQRLGLKGDVVVVPPGCDSMDSLPDADRARCEHPRIVCVGRIVSHKNTHSIIRAVPSLLEHFENLTVHVVGDGPERQSLEELIVTMRLEHNVFIHGSLSSFDRDQLMRSAWISVSASEGEGWGLSVIEANSLGVPVLAYNRPGLQDSIRHEETGWLMNEQDSLAEAIAMALNIVSNVEASNEFAIRARQWASQFTWEQMTDRLIEILEAEASRLSGLNEDRRIVSDVNTVVRLPARLVEGNLHPMIRRTDRCIESGDDLVLILRNTNLHSSHNAIRWRLISELNIAHHEEHIQLSVARPVDLNFVNDC